MKPMTIGQNVMTIEMNKYNKQVIVYVDDRALIYTIR